MITPTKQKISQNSSLQIQMLLLFSCAKLSWVSQPSFKKTYNINYIQLHKNLKISESIITAIVNS